MTCPRCNHEIELDFYCIHCGYVPPWARNAFEIAAFEAWRADFKREGVRKSAA